ncbi:di-N-acetylchitobiase-like [Rhincodon typus]|uniref:di-N-acetylchitobiase-like n=1 Tax=Rhincodon typus TaxID=259920 RepID=UPI0020309398|nr:di-N-acetylchitobiase-like [Rhincodon typus]
MSLLIQSFHEWDSFKLEMPSMADSNLITLPGFEALKIQCSSTSSELLNETGGYILKCRGPLLVKGKGEMTTWWLEGKACDGTQIASAQLETPSGPVAFLGLTFKKTILKSAVVTEGTARSGLSGQPGRCQVPANPYRGAPCSSYLMKSIPFKEVVQQLSKSITGRYWDDYHKAPYYVYLVSMSIPWTPDCPDGKCYDYTSIAQSCDFLYVKAHDTQHEMWDDCFAKANAPYDETLSGLSYYIKLGVDPKKLVLGLPWYGYDYPCEHFYEPGRCKLKTFPLEVASCSSRIVNQVEYKEIMQMLPRSITGRYWDDNYKSPYFVYKDKDVYHEVWYDDPESLSLKSSIVKKLKLGGVGAWFGNSLNYSENPTAAMQTEDMWNALCPIRLKWRT